MVGSPLSRRLDGLHHALVPIAYYTLIDKE
jgi:hypothetical protein